RRGPIDAEGRRRREPGELFLPERRYCGSILPSQPSDVFAVRPRALEAERAPAAVGLVEREELLDHDLRGPPVEQQVVQAEDEAVDVVGEADQRSAEQRRARRIEASLAIVVDEAAHAIGLLVGGKAAEIDLLERELEPPPHDLNGL